MTHRQLGRASFIATSFIAVALAGCSPAPGRSATPDPGTDSEGADAASGRAGAGGQTGPGTGGAAGSTSNPGGGTRDAGPSGDAPAQGPGGTDATTGGPVTSADGGVPSTGKVDWLTHKFDNARTGWNANEQILTPALVSDPNKFGKLFSRLVDGQIFAQPLVVTGVMVGAKARDLVIVATQANNVYAFDAQDAAQTMPVWMVNLGKPVTPAEVQGTPDIAPLIGITATPTVDLASGTIYVTSKTVEAGPYVHKLHALDLATGTEKYGGPATLTGSVPGNAAGSKQGTLTFDPRTHLNRPGLLLQAGTVFIAFASHSDANNYQGWVMAYDAKTLKRTGVFVTAANKGRGGGVWMGGNGLVGDGTSVYFTTGNGFNGATDPTTTPPQLSESMVRLDNTLALKDWGMRGDYARLDGVDADFGSSGPLLIPKMDRLISGGKDSFLLVYDKNSLGKYKPNDTDAVLQKFLGTGPDVLQGTHFGGVVYWEGPVGPMVFAWPSKGKLLGFKLAPDKTFDTTPAVVGPDVNNNPRSGVMVISSQGARNGIVWVNLGSGDTSFFALPGTLRAYDASNGKALWNSNTNRARDNLGLHAKLTLPTVANGKVYVGSWTGSMLDASAHAVDSKSTLQVYGALP